MAWLEKNYQKNFKDCNLCNFQKDQNREKLSKLKSDVMKKYIEAGVSFDLVKAEKIFK